jgi:folate-binding protein YgfZ
MDAEDTVLKKYEEYAALTAGCGLIDRSPRRGLLELTGADRQRFLNAYATCDVKSLAAGAGLYGFLTSAQGRILSDLAVLALPDRLWLEVGAGREADLTDHLRKYILVDRVEIHPLEKALLTLIGPRSAAVLAELGLPEPAADWHHAAAALAGAEVTVARTGLLGAPAFTLWASPEAAPELEVRLRARDGVVAVGEEALDVLRVEAGIPRYGVDFGPDNFPQETGIEEAVSYTKGCYLGQEVVARIHYRGGVQKILRRLEFDGGAEAPAAGVPLLAEGREAGTASSVVRSPVSGQVRGLGIVHKRAAEPGTRLEVAGGGTAVVV